jgi:predicted nucleic-acid-binding protein
MEVSGVKLLDTNVIVRTIVCDDPRQTLLADAELASGPIHIPLTVLMETEWVLRSIFKLPRAEVNMALRDLIAIEHVSTENEAHVQQALDFHATGADFADMIHACAAPDADEFVTFDKVLAKAGVPGSMAVRVMG